MNGAEHYAEAERLIEGWQQFVDETSADDPTLPQQMADAAPMVVPTLLAAVGHALLAHTAAAASSVGILRDEWARVLYPQPASEATP